MEENSGDEREHIAEEQGARARARAGSEDAKAARAPIASSRYLYQYLTLLKGEGEILSYRYLLVLNLCMSRTKYKQVTLGTVR